MHFKTGHTDSKTMLCAIKHSVRSLFVTIRNEFEFSTNYFVPGVVDHLISLQRTDKPAEKQISKIQVLKKIIFLIRNGKERNSAMK